VSPDAIGVRDLPFAIAETTNRYVEGNYWTAVNDGKKGLAFFNRGTMGSVRETDGGFSLPLAYAMHYIWGTRMLEGDFTYEFALFPFSGGWRDADLHREAVAYNFPVVSISGRPGYGTLADTFEPFDPASTNLLLSALYPGGRCVFARFYEYRGQNAETTFAYRQGLAAFSETDLLGRNRPLPPGPLQFHPWQFRMFQIEPVRKAAE
jgi:alpha-mannosidase